MLENDKNLQDDNWRFRQVCHETSNPNHPYRRFGTGNFRCWQFVQLEHIKNWLMMQKSAVCWVVALVLKLLVRRPRTYYVGRPFTYCMVFTVCICMTTLYPSNSPGNKYTLKTRPQEQGVDVREELLKYHDKYYSSNLMTLAIVGKGTSSARPVLECVYCYFFVISIRQMKH